MDFAKRGRNNFVRFIIESTAFINARAQSLYRLGRGPGGKRSVFLAMALRGFVLTAISLGLNALFGDDERYKMLSDQEKSMSYHFWLNDVHYVIPKAFEVGTLFSTVPEAMMDVFRANAEEPDKVEQSLNLVGYSFLETMNFMPKIQAVWPLFELAINKDTIVSYQSLRGNTTLTFRLRTVHSLGYSRLSRQTLSAVLSS